jgi:multiple sugar transport system substrate-binding protein
MMKKLLALLLVGVLTLYITACSSGDSQVSSQGDGKEISGELTIMGWGGGDELKARKEATKVFQKLYPKVKVKEIWLPADSVDQKLDAALAAGNAADVIMMSPDWKGLRSKWFEDLNPYLEKDNIDVADLTPGADDGYVDPDGKREGMPTTQSDFMFAYNKEIFDKAGVPYPTNDWTWDDFKNVAEKVSSGSGANRTYAIVSHWILQSFAYLPYGGTPYNSDWTKQTIEDPNAIKALELFANLVKSKALPDDAASKSIPMDQMFVAGKAAIYPLGLFEAGEIAKKIGNNFKWGIVLPPKDPNGKNTNIKFQTGFAMNKDSKNKNAAWAYIKTISMNKEVNDIYAKVGIPALKESADSTFSKLTIPNTDIKQTDYLTGLADATTFPWGGSINKAGDLYEQIWQQITTQGSSPKDAVKKYAPQIQEALEEIHQKK